MMAPDIYQTFDAFKESLSCFRSLTHLALPALIKREAPTIIYLVKHCKYRFNSPLNHVIHLL